MGRRAHTRKVVSVGMPKVLITGAAGVLGSYLDFGFKTDKRVADVTDFEESLAIARGYGPDVILHLAAMTDTKACEERPWKANEINGAGTYHMALIAKEVGARLIYLSTNEVFDGRKGGLYSETDAPNPQTAYGRSKHLGELAVMGVLSDYLIIRTSWVFGGGPKHDKKFVGKIIQQFSQPEIAVVTDQTGSPTYAKDLAEQIRNLIRGFHKGIVHVTNGGVCSRFEMAQEMIKILKPSVALTPIRSGHFDPNLVPASYGLSSKLPALRSWQDALREYLETEWSRYGKSSKLPKRQLLLN